MAAPRAAPRRFVVIAALAAAGAVAVTGVVVSGVVLTVTDAATAAMPPAFWLAALLSICLTVSGLWLRTLRFAFLLRRAEVRLPLWPVVTAYLAGFALLLVPLFLGELIVRAWLLRRRGVPVAITITVNGWERLADLVAILTVGGLAGLLIDPANPVAWLLLLAPALALVPAARRLALLAIAALANLAVRMTFGRASPVQRPALQAMVTTRAWLVTWGASSAVWVIPGIGFWAIVTGAGGSLEPVMAIAALARSDLLAAVVLAPAGVAVVGPTLLLQLLALGVPEPVAGLAILALRLTTGGVAISFGLLMFVIGLRQPADDGDHFDHIAHAYDAQIPEARRLGLLNRKMGLIADRLAPGQQRGLDIGCGQGAGLEWLRDRGLHVVGVDTASGQVHAATRRLGSGVAQTGSVLALPFEDDRFDFAYTINVLHHLPGRAAQAAGLAEIRRVVRPGGSIFIHEINTRNILFRFYMGYVFPLLNAIDEGTEHWLSPRLAASLSQLPLVGTAYFTFLPEFAPPWCVRLCRPVERWLEAGPAGVFSAHWFAQLQVPLDAGQLASIDSLHKLS